MAESQFPPPRSSKRAYAGLLVIGGKCPVCSLLPSKGTMPLLSAAIPAYIILLVLLATASPGVGGFGWLLLSFPEQFLDYLHVPAYGLLAWLGITGLSRRGWSLFPALAVASLSTLVFGLWTETLQVSVPGRGLELQDVILDGIGIVAADIVAFRRSARLRLARGRYSRSITTLEDPA